MVLVTAVLCLLFSKLNNNLAQEFEQTKEAYSDGVAVNLAKGVKAETLANVLSVGNYVEEDDAQFIAGQLVSKLNEGNTLSSLYDLKKMIFQVPASLADSLGGKGMKARVKESYETLKVDSIPAAIPQNSWVTGKGRITVVVQEKKPDSLVGSLDKLLHKNKKPVEGVWVRLMEHYPDSLVRGYAKTDDQGRVVFDTLDTERYYSVLPIQKGFEYGSSRGTTGGNLGAKGEGRQAFSFTRTQHTIRLLDDQTFQQIKADDVLTVRTPADFKGELTKCLMLFFAVWWGLYFILRIRKRPFNREIVALLMLLTGFCLLVMFAINNPLTDGMLGLDMLQGILMGVVAIGLLQMVDFVKFFQDGYVVKFDFTLQFFGWLFMPFRGKVKPLTAVLTDRKKNGLVKSGALLCILAVTPFLVLDLLQVTRLDGPVQKLLSRLPKGFGYLLAALALTALLWSPLGSEVGGMKVNLNIFGLVFQPSEIAKYLIMIFMAAFFYQHVDKIVRYSEVGNSALFGRKFLVLLGILCGLAVLLAIYFRLGDMGPALVLAVSFILLYSIIKSKDQLGDLTEGERYRRIFASDFAMLLYGIASFALMLAIGHRYGNMGIFCLLWFALWIVFGLTRKKQIFESAIFMNVIVAAFIFGGTVMKPLSASTGERLDDRMEMCVNTWGTLDLEHNADHKPVINNQVAQGLWGLASGGVKGQGLGKGSPSLIPAFHTDMILESIGELLGWWGLLIVVVCLALLLRQCIVAGYRTAHPFAFYLATGIAIVTGVQFMIISLGSTGMIPLTGITVPFLSFGRVSMILNLAAFGIVLSLSHRHGTVIEAQKKNIGAYNYTVAIASLSYICLAAVVMGVFLNYQSEALNRDKTLIRPVFVNGTNGAPIVEYNPRIARVMKKLHAGNIYDRSGKVILATSDKSLVKPGDYEKYGLESHAETILKKRTQRYYPFGEHLLFMVGDYNTGVPFAYYEHNPIGYLAESQHLAALRGFDNILYDDPKSPDKKPVKVNLSSDKFRASPFAPVSKTQREGVVLRNYEAILPCLKKSREIDKWNARREKRDITLTVDAGLQTRMQQAIEGYMTKPEFSGRGWNKVRVSVVVLDASSGDLLTSANYPLPVQDSLRRYARTRYTDREKIPAAKAYSDRDLGLTYQTMPGSTAKVMSALAGLQKFGKSIADTTYYIDARETVEPPSAEPNFQRDKHNTTMEEAIKYSSNNYFINLVNDKELYENLDSIYQAVGIRIPNREMVDGKEVSRPLTPYFFQPEADYADKGRYRTAVVSVGQENIRTYRDYIEKRRNAGVYEQMSGYHNGHDWNKMAWAWGQNDLGASPLNMARVAAIVANKGQLVETQFIKTGNKMLEVEKRKPVGIVTKDEAEILKKYMQNESAKHGRFTAEMGGKTGTPERDMRQYAGGVDQKGHPRMKSVKLNDGWYIFFIDSATAKAPLAVAVRMERLPEAKGNTSRRAVELTGEVILTALRNEKYID